MRTPAGKECPYFYGDYHRGKQKEECRLLNDAGLMWKREYCANCQVPDILMANACEHMELSPQIQKPFFFMKAKVHVKATCNKTNQDVEKPEIGCGQCHSLPQEFLVTQNDDNPTT